ncbi:tetratricopeptide repeat protein 9C-like [Colletes gigas]|uniref:tetratricopeptide repeat protein 9C-like n=1 Tax=Colletes gigas TaxID=935657 RepID=UPI001C9BB443|nr:tetratricopeptide repeat protein 9C-like [Colletes gigas]
MMPKVWESADKRVRKDIIKSCEFSKKPTERASCEVVIENIRVENTSLDQLKETLHLDILDGTGKKTLIIGEANCEIDSLVERAIEMMMVLEKSLVTLSVSFLDQPILINFEITLTKMQPHKPIWEWTPQEKYLIALKYKETGVCLFKESRWVDAFHKFTKACKILITLEPIPDLELDTKLENDINNLRLILYNNIAGCQLNRQNYELTISLCDKILSKDCNNIKALYRRGIAHGNLKDYDSAVNDLKTVVTLEPQNRAAQAQFSFYNTKLIETNKKIVNMIKKMFKT